MQFFIGMFSRLAGSRMRAAQMRAMAKVRAKTVGRLQNKMMKGMSAMDRAVNRGMDGKFLKDKAQAAKGKMGGNAAAGGPPPVGAARISGPVAEEDWGVPAAPQPVQASEEVQQKTMQIDVSQLYTQEEPELVGWIVAMSGVDKGKDFKIFDGKNLIGSGADCDIVVSDPYVSAKHCTIRHENGNFFIIDLDSSNGTFLNQKKITKGELIDNDSIRFGRTEFKFKSLY